jgi:hypothetical protein
MPGGRTSRSSAPSTDRGDRRSPEPLHRDGLRAGSGDAGGAGQETAAVGAASGGPGFAAAGGGGGGGAAGSFKAPNHPNQHTGHFAIQVVAPNPVASDEAFYSVSCVQQTAPAGPGALQPGPGAGKDGT